MKNRLKGKGTSGIEGKSSGLRSFRNDVAEVVARCLNLFYMVTCHPE